MKNEEFNNEQEESKSLWMISISLVFFMFILLFINLLISQFHKVEFDNIESDINNIKINNELFLSNYKNDEDFLEKNDKHIIKFKNDKHVKVFCENLIYNLEIEESVPYSAKKLNRIKGQVFHFENQIYDDSNISQDSKKAIQLVHEFALEINKYVNIMSDQTEDQEIKQEDIEKTYKKGKLGTIIASDTVEEYIKKD